MKEHQGLLSCQRATRWWDVPAMQPLHITLRLWSRSEVSYCHLELLGCTFGEVPQLRGHLRSSEVFPLLSKLGCPHWCLWQEVRPRSPCPQVPVVASPPGLMPWEGANLWAPWCVGCWYLPISCWEPGNLCLPECVAISVPPVCWENVRTSPDSLQSQELHCLNLCQLCF